jgi:hypothetical protein
MEPSFDVPEATIVETLGASQLAKGPVERRCRVYRTFAVLEQVDPGLKGAVRVSVRGRPEGTDATSACTSGPERVLEEPEIYLWGVIGSYVFLKGADSFGLLSPFVVYDARTGARTFAGARDAAEPFRVVRAGEHLRLEYAAAFASPCALAQDPSCWTRILTEQQVPTELGLAVPDCRASFARAGSPLDNAAHVSLPAQISLTKPSLLWRAGQARCEPAP